jgi:hypothetical protein
MGTLIGKIVVEPEKVAAGQPVFVQVCGPNGQPLTDPEVTVSMMGVPATERYMQFATPGTRKLIIRAVRGKESETAEATIEVEASTAPSATQILRVKPVAGQPYAANFRVGVPPRLRPALARATALASEAASTVEAARPAPPPPVAATGKPVAPSYKWDFGDGQTLTTAAPTATHDYFPAIQAGKVAHSFHVSCTAEHENLTVRQTLVLHSAYGLCRQLGVIVPPVTGDVYAAFQHVGYSASMVVHNLEASPITLTRMACVPLSKDAGAALPPPHFIEMKVPVVLAANSAAGLGVYIAQSQLKLAGIPGTDITGFTVYYSGEMPDKDGKPVPVRFSYAFCISIADARHGNLTSSLAPANWDTDAALRAVSAAATHPKVGVSKPGGQVFDPATKTVAIALSTNPRDVSTLSHVRAAIQAGLTSIAQQHGAASAPPSREPAGHSHPAPPLSSGQAHAAAAGAHAGAALPRPEPAGHSRPAPPPPPGQAHPAPVVAHAAVLFDPSNAPPVAEGNECYPDDISDADAATAKAGSLVCQATGPTVKQLVPASFQNAQQGDIILSPAPTDGGDMIAAMFAALTPPQHHGHSGIMTLNFFEITHCTASPARITANINKDALGVPTSLMPDMLQYAWPGSITQTIDDATTSISLNDPSGTAYQFSSFDPSPEGSGFEIIPPLVVKPLPENEAAVRPTLRKVADTARSKGARYVPQKPGEAGTLTQKGGCYYSFYSYTKPDVALGFTDPAPADAGWAQGLSPAVCSGFVWLCMKENNIPLVTPDEYEQLADFSQTAIAGGAQVGPATRDGLVYYPEAERVQGAQALHQMILNQALAQEDGLGTIPGVNDSIAGPIADQLINMFAFGNPNMVGSTAWQSPGDGNAVSPDNIIYWNPPYFGYAEPLQYLPQHTEQYTESVWHKVVTKGNIKGTVRANGAPAPNAHVWVYLPGGDAWTKPDGSYSLENIPTGPYLLKAQATLTVNGVSAEYTNGAGRHVTLAANQALTENIDILPLPANYRRADISRVSITCDHGDDNPFNAHGVKSAGPFSHQVSVNPGHTTDSSYTYSFDYNGGGYFHIDFAFTISLVDKFKIELKIVATMKDDGSGSQQAQSTFGPVSIDPGATCSNQISIEHSQAGYHNGPATLKFSVTNNQQTG